MDNTHPPPLFPTLSKLDEILFKIKQHTLFPFSSIYYFHYQSQTDIAKIFSQQKEYRFSYYN